MERRKFNTFQELVKYTKDRISFSKNEITEQKFFRFKGEEAKIFRRAELFRRLQAKNLAFSKANERLFCDSLEFKPFNPIADWLNSPKDVPNENPFEELASFVDLEGKAAFPFAEMLEKHFIRAVNSILGCLAAQGLFELFLW